MESSEIGHDINLLGTHLDSLLLASALVHGHLGLGRMFYFDQEKDDTKWSTTGELDLRNANIGAIHAPLQLSFWPQLIRFGGFSLGQFLSTDCSEEVQPCAAGEDWYEQWLNLGDFESQKSFQSHQIIMNMLLAQGDRDSANQVGVDGHDKELMYSVTEGKWSHFLFLFLSKDTVGYGLHPEWCVLSILLATCLGAYVFTRTNEARKWKMRFGIAYSFDMLLPIIRLRELHYKIDIRGPARYYLYIHRLLGFVFGSFLVAAFAGWVK